MPNASDIAWFKENFAKPITAAVAGTPFDLDMLTAIACQETGYIWQVLRRKNLPLDRTLALCVGDTLDANRGRSAFPKTKADLLARPNGDAMFAIARQALVDVARYIPAFSNVAKQPNKFCHGFGVFQYDLQFFLKDPNYFLQKKYEQFDQTLRKCLEELNQVYAAHGTGLEIEVVIERLRNGMRRHCLQHRTLQAQERTAAGLTSTARNTTARRSSISSGCRGPSRFPAARPHSHLPRPVRR